MVAYEVRNRDEREVLDLGIGLSEHEDFRGRFCGRWWRAVYAA